jgi:ribosome biogenesis GTPase
MKKKGQRETRKHDWQHRGDDAFTRDLAKHRKAAAKGNVPKLPPPVPQDQVVPNGLVVGHVGHYAFVFMDGEHHLCLIDPALGEKTTTLLAPGDDVMVEQYEEQWVVRGFAPRRTKLSRLAHIHNDTIEQVVAANVDLLMIIATPVQPRLKPGFIDRYLITAQVGGVTPLLVLNKMDLVDEEPEEIQHYRDFELPIIHASAKTGMGLEIVREMLASKISVFAGQSGVGKTSLLNALDPNLDLDTQEVSAATEKGRHTTSASRLYILRDNIRIIDTPGIRSLGLWQVTSQEVAFHFPEIAEQAQYCRFRDCRHSNEPGCAVRDAVEQGSISRLRYQSYLLIRQNLKERETY